MHISPLIFAARILDAFFPKDDNPEHWGTINGSHVHYNSQGEIDGGARGKLNSNKHKKNTAARSPLQEAAKALRPKPIGAEPVRMSPAERERVYHEINTWFHKRFVGQSQGTIQVRNHEYHFYINDFGDYYICAKRRLK